MVKLHGGAIRVTSQVGRGSRFTVVIPFGTAHLPKDRIRQAQTRGTTNVRAQAYIDEALGWLSDSVSDSEKPPPPSSSEDVGNVAPVAPAESPLVLLVDDNVDMRNYVHRLLTERYTVESVGDGEAALEAARRRRPDLILTDIMMPRLDGFGLLHALRSDSDLRDIPVIFLSARAGAEASVEGLDAGADDYLTKPFSARELLARVRANLDMASLRREAARVENELRRQAQMAHEQVEGILASINDGFLALNQDWCFTYVNAAAQRMMDRTAEELIGKILWEEYPESIGTATEIHYRRAMAERTSITFENYNAPLHRWFDVRAYPARDGGLSVLFQDITERKHVEDALRDLNETLEVQVAQRTAELQAKEERLRTIFETSYTYQGLLAPNGTLLDANATSLAGIGAKLEDVLGKPFGEAPWFCHTPGMPETVRRAISLVASGETVRQEIHVKLPVGGWRWFDFQMRPVRNDRDEVVAIVPEAVEVTERRQAEEAFRQAQKMEGIGQLTGGVAHDFNNLLTIIVGNLEILQRQLKMPSPTFTTFEGSVDSAMRGAQRAVSLTQRLLAFSRQQPLDPKPVDVSQLVTGMSDLLRRTIGEQIAIETVLAGGLWRANIDAHHLEIAILNLVVNARDAMPRGGRLTIETSNILFNETDAADQADMEPGQYVMLAVADTGTGMNRETLARVFEPFFTTKDVGHGTGLGLSQVYGFVKQSGGHVKIHSNLGEGTTVKIYLPRSHVDDVTGTAEPIEKIAGGQDGETILMVEDDADVRAYTHGILGELGYNVLEASNGNVALEILEKRPDIRLLFTDVGLPGGMNGGQLADAARKKRHRLKVLFTTGYARDVIVHDGRVDPGVQLITKPFSYPALAGKLRDVLDAPADPGRLLVVEDEVLIQMLLNEYLEELGFKAEIVASAADAKSKLHSLSGEIDAAIVDVGLPDMRGDALVSELRSVYPMLPIVIASGHDEVTLQRQFMGEKCIGFLRKPYNAKQLRSALSAVGVFP